MCPPDSPTLPHQKGAGILWSAASCSAAGWARILFVPPSTPQDPRIRYEALLYSPALLMGAGWGGGDIQETRRRITPLHPACPIGAGSGRSIGRSASPGRRSG
jgi:hypothetical protein